MIIPFYSIIIYVLFLLDIPGYNHISININEGLFSLVWYIVMVLWVSSKLVNVLKISSDIIYEKNRNSNILKKIKSFVFILLMILLITLMIISVLFIIYFLESIIGIKIYFIIFIIQLILEFIFITFLSSLIYKYIIPVKIKFKNILMLGCSITLIWYIVLLFYKLFIKFFGINSYYLLYGNIAKIIVFILMINLMVNVYIYGLIFNYYIVKIGKNNKV